MNAGMRYEIRARAFELMTGQLAPGKDAPAAANGSSYEDREAAWLEWHKKYGPCVDSLMQAIQELED